jgi:hypothetical protein
MTPSPGGFQNLLPPSSRQLRRLPGAFRELAAPQSAFALLLHDPHIVVVGRERLRVGTKDIIVTEWI